MEEITPERVVDLLDGGEAPTIVDIRQPPAFRRGHIPGSRNVPFRQLPDRVAELADADHIVTVCPHGKSSVQAARLIESYEGTADATVESMAGGLSEWPGEIASGDVDGSGSDPSASQNAARSGDAGAEPDEGPTSPF